MAEAKKYMRVLCRFTGETKSKKFENVEVVTSDAWECRMIPFSDKEETEEVFVNSFEADVQSAGLNNPWVYLEHPKSTMGKPRPIYCRIDPWNAIVGTRLKCSAWPISRHGKDDYSMAHRRN